MRRLTIQSLQRLTIPAALSLYTVFFAFFPGCCISGCCILTLATTYGTIGQYSPPELLRALIINCAPYVIVAIVLLLYLNPNQYGRYRRWLAFGAALSACLALAFTLDYLFLVDTRLSSFEDGIEWARIFDAWMTGMFLGYFVLTSYPLLRKKPATQPAEDQS